MKNKPIKNKPTSSGKAKLNGQPVNLFYTLILLAYTFVTVFTPNLDSFDSLGPKFLSLSLLNILAFLILFAGNKVRHDSDISFFFFHNRVGFIYLLLMIVSLLSFFKAFNILESVLHYAKIFSVFTAAFLVSIILRSDKRYLTHLALAMVSLLVIDSISVFYNIAQGITAGLGPRIGELKSVYSNKNILAASIFVKIPFALWLLTFKKGYVKVFAIVALFLAFVATLLMSTRAFYLGSILLFLAFLAFTVIRFYRKNEKRKLVSLLVYSTGTVILGIIIFSVVLKYLYPQQTGDVYTLDFISRLKTIGGGGGIGGQLRTTSWERSVKLISEEPILGVGLGNWKVDVLKYENLTSVDYIYMYKNHNDFLETAAETGITGGLLFIAVFLMIFYNFIKAFFRTDAVESSYMYLFLPAFGLFCYVFDAFFNFPADRPEIASLFAIYVGAGVAYSPAIKFFDKLNVPRPASRVPILIAVFMVLMMASSWVLWQNYLSLKLQRKFAEDKAKGSLTLPSSMFLKGFPSIPDINVQGEPIAVHKARYLISEKKFGEALEILKKDHSSPYDTRPEFFIANCYNELGNRDSAIVYFYKVYRQKPLFYNNTRTLAVLLQASGRYKEAAEVLSGYLGKAKKTSEAWVIASDMYEKAGENEKALAVLDTALRYLPGDAQVQSQRTGVVMRQKIKPYQALYTKAVETYYAKNYREAVRLLTDFIGKEPGLPEAYDFRAFSYYFLKEYKKGIADINKFFTFGIPKPNLLNLRGVFYQQLGDMTAACRDFDQAGKEGDKDGASNFSKFCLQQKRQ